MIAARAILFDLDGTLTDPREGITRSIAYARVGEGAVEVEEDGAQRRHLFDASQSSASAHCTFTPSLRHSSSR